VDNLFARGAYSAGRLKTTKDIHNASSDLGEGKSHGGCRELWQACVDQLAQELPEQQFNTWIRPLVAEVRRRPVHTVTMAAVANRFKLDWVRAQYAGRIARHCCEKFTASPVQLELALAPREAVVRLRPIAFVPRAPANAASAGCRARRQGSTTAPAGCQTPRRQRRFKTRLNTALTFDNLVEPARANRMARTAAAMHVSGTPRGSLYNPLVHLRRGGPGQDPPGACGGQRAAGRQAAGAESSLHPRRTVCVSDVVKAYQRKTFDEFKERYHSLDLLLIDDVQFFANKDRTQEEFFNAFEALLARKSRTSS
jgi:chromosomal replication initiator protein